MLHRRTLFGSLVLLCTTLAPALDTLRAADNGKPNTLSPGRQRSGWSLLFDGKSLAGWAPFRAAAGTKGWRVENGLLRRDPSGGDLISDREFENFELSLDYCVAAGSSSGVLFRVLKTAALPEESGPEVQIVDNQSAETQKSGWIVDLIPAQKRWPDGDRPEDATRPAGQWNHLQLLVTQNACEINLNGTRYAEFILDSPDWNESLAKSRFAKIADFAKAARGHLCLQHGAGTVWFCNVCVRELGADGSAPDPIDGALSVWVAEAFPRMQWAGWQPETDDGRNEPLRPIVLTHAGDGSHRLFLASQHGTIRVFKNDQEARQSEVFLDIRDLVRYADLENEEGFLGLAFHPRYRETGEFFVYYTPRTMPREVVISRFRVSKENPNRADPKSEQQLLHISQPYWNHKGGTLAFGPDGYLYVGMGDGGSANDPGFRGQDLSTLLGKVLRIDIDGKSALKSADGKYALPSDNPFVGRAGARPEIYAYGFRNIWRLSFDRRQGSYGRPT